jgi:hypothetical protein
MEDIENFETKFNETENNKNMLIEEKNQIFSNLDETKNGNYISTNLIQGI